MHTDDIVELTPSEMERVSGAEITLTEAWGAVVGFLSWMFGRGATYEPID